MKGEHKERARLRVQFAYDQPEAFDDKAKGNRCQACTYLGKKGPLVGKVISDPFTGCGQFQRFFLFSYGL
jgi:hypothetical protein